MPERSAHSTPVIAPHRGSRGGSCATPAAPTAETLEHAETARKQLRFCDAFDAACVGGSLPMPRVRRMFKIRNRGAAAATPMNFLRVNKIVRARSAAKTSPRALASCTGHTPRPGQGPRTVAEAAGQRPCASVAEAAIQRLCPNEPCGAAPHLHFQSACEGRCRFSTAHCGSHLCHGVGPPSRATKETHLSTVAEAARTPREALKKHIPQLIVSALPVIARRSNDAFAEQIARAARRYALRPQLDSLVEYACPRCFAAAVLLINWKLEERPRNYCTAASVRQLVRHFHIDLARLHSLEIKVLNVMYGNAHLTNE